MAHVAHFSVLVLLLVSVVGADTITGKVVGVRDGDTLTVSVDKKLIAIRLVGIDAPELRQFCGDTARQALSAKALGKEVTIETQGTDTDDRTLGIVYVGTIDLNTELVQEGLAWYDKQQRASSALESAQSQAKASKRGLWAASDPVPPWEYREAEADRMAAKAAGELENLRPSVQQQAMQADSPMSRIVQQIAAWLMAGVIGFVAAQLYDRWRKRIHIHLDCWSWGRPEATLPFVFTVRLFSNKARTVGLHRFRVDFVRRGAFGRNVLESVGIECLCSGNVSDWIHVPPREWVVVQSMWRHAKQKSLLIAKCNSAYLTCYTAEGNRKRWLLRTLREGQIEEEAQATESATKSSLSRILGSS